MVTCSAVLQTVIAPFTSETAVKVCQLCRRPTSTDPPNCPACGSMVFVAP